MINCPDKNLTSWKSLVDVVKEEEAYSLWNEFDGAVPEMYYIKGSSITDELKLKAIDNGLHEQYLTILSSEEYRQQMMQPNTDKNIKKLCTDMKIANTNDSSFRTLDMLGMLYHISSKQGAQLGKNVLGQAALHTTDHIMSQLADIYLREQRPNFQGIEKVQEDTNITTLATYRDIDGVRISDTISEMTNALVDVLKEPYIKYSGITEHNASTFFYMLRTGLTLKQVIHFFNHPLIRYYNKEIAKRQFNNNTYNTTLHKNLISEIVSSFNDNPKFDTSGNKIPNTQIISLTNKNLEEATLLQQPNYTSFDYSVVKEFDRLFNAASKVNELMRVSKFDTAGMGTSFGENRGMVFDFKKFETDNNLGQNKQYIENWENKFIVDGNKTTLGAYKEVVEEGIEYFNNLYTANSYSQFTDKLDDLLKNVLSKNRVTLSSKYVSDFATYITQNYGEFPSSLIKKSKSSEGTVAEKIKQVLKGKNEALKNNLFLKSLILDTTQEQHKIMLQSGTISDVYASESLSTSFSELAYIDGALARDIVKVGILQDGFSKSSYSFLQIIPIDFKLQEAATYYSVLSNIKLEDFDTKFKILNYKKVLKIYSPSPGREFRQPDNTYFIGRKNKDGNRQVTLVINDRTFTIGYNGTIEGQTEDVIIGRSSLDYRDSVLGKITKVSPTAEEFKNSFESNIQRIKKEQCQ
jgi:hypothetical protein